MHAFKMQCYEHLVYNKLANILVMDMPVAVITSAVMKVAVIKFAVMVVAVMAVAVTESSPFLSLNVLKQGGILSHFYLVHILMIT